MDQSFPDVIKLASVYTVCSLIIPAVENDACGMAPADWLNRTVYAAHRLRICGIHSFAVQFRGAVGRYIEVRFSEIPPFAPVTQMLFTYVDT